MCDRDSKAKYFLFVAKKQVVEGGKREGYQDTVVKMVSSTSNWMSFDEARGNDPWGQRLRHCTEHFTCEVRGQAVYADEGPKCQSLATA